MGNSTPQFGGLLILLFGLNLISSILEALVLTWRGRTGRGPAYDWGSFGLSFVDMIVRNILRVVLPAGFRLFCLDFQCEWR